MKAKILFEARNVPAYQNKMFETRKAALECPTGNVVLAQDPSSGLVVNIEYDPHLLRYDETYQNEQGVSTQFRGHLEQVLDKLMMVFRDDDILEIGCGKGMFVELMRARGIKARGIDNAYEGNSPYIEKRHFGTVAETPTKAIVLRHVLEHIPNPLNFLRLVAEANGGHGFIYIEVPCFDWIMRSKAWFDIFYEHVNYFRLSDFRKAFDDIIDSGYLFGGQYLYVIASLSSLRKFLKEENQVHLTLPLDFNRALDQLAIRALAAPMCKRIIWGAAAKGVMFAYHLGLRGVRFEAAVDINPGKQGRFLALTALEVVAPEVALGSLPPGSEIYVMNSNYLAEISSLGGNQFRYISVDKL